MKAIKIFLAVIIVGFLSGNSVLGQSFWEWSDPVPLTDSLSDNTNHCLQRINGPDQQMFLAWEKQLDSVSTAIYFDNILDDDPPEIILSEPGVIFTHPKILTAHQYPSTDSVFFLFYQTDQNGSEDIYYITYLSDGSFLPPVAFASTSFDDIELDIGGSAFTDAGYIMTELVWISDGKIMNSSYLIESGQPSFSEAVVVDSTNCSTPVFNESWITLFYLKENTSGEKHIYRATKSNNSWSGVLFYDAGNCENVATDHFFSGYTIWSAFIDSTWKLVMFDEFSPSVFDLEKETPYRPGIMGNSIVFKQNSQFDYAYIAFPYPEAGHDEIYMNPDPNGGVTFENFTNSAVENRNTVFYLGEDENPNCFYAYLLWESKRNGYWQIWSSKTLLCIGGIDEEEHSESFITTYPNPFNDETRIEFTLKKRSHVIIDIFNSKGMRITFLAAQQFDQGDHQLRWNADDLPSGIYFIKMAVGDQVFTSKLIKE